MSAENNNRVEEILKGNGGMSPEEVAAICGEAMRRFGGLSRYIAPHAALQLIKAGDPVHAISSIQLSFVCLLFKNGHIIFKDKAGEEGSDGQS